MQRKIGSLVSYLMIKIQFIIFVKIDIEKNNACSIVEQTDIKC